MNLPDRRANTYESLEKRLDEHIERIEDRFHKRFRGMLIAFSLIGITSAVALGGFSIVLEEQQEHTDRIEQLAEENKALSQEIQAQRKDSIRALCEDQNARNKGTSQALIDAAQKDIDSRTTEAEKVENRRRRDVTLALIDALAPVQDCDKVVAEAVPKTG